MDTSTIFSMLNENKIKQAEKSIARLLRSDLTPHKQAEILIVRAKARLMNARPESALDDLQTARTLDAAQFQKSITLEILGDSYFARFELSPTGFVDRNDIVLSKEAYETIISNDPDYTNIGWVYYQLGRVYLAEANIVKAEQYLHIALLSRSYIQPLVAYCYERLGFIAFYEKRDLPQSINFLSKSIDTCPTDFSRAWLAQVYILRARVYVSSNRNDEALEDVNSALNLTGAQRQSTMKDTFTEALLTKAEILKNVSGREKELISCLEQYMQVSKKPLGVDVTHARAFEMLADAYLVLGKYTRSIEAYNSVLQYNPYHPWELSVYYRISRAYYLNGNYEKAIEAVKYAINTAKRDGQDIDYRLYDLYGNAYFALKQYDKAADAYKTAINIAPDNEEHLSKIRQYYQYSLDLMNQTL